MRNLLNDVKGNIYGLGVYCFKDIDGNVIYVGSGMLNDRLQSHLYSLKRGLYEGTNKDVIQRSYNLGNLTFEVLHYSTNNNTYINGTKQEKAAIQHSLETLEQFYYDLYKDTCCNKRTKITKWSTSPTLQTTLKRKRANMGSGNPNVKYDEDLIANIMYLKEQGLKPRQIVELLEEHDINVRQGYISQIGITKWIHIKSVRPDWYDDESKLVCDVK